MTRIFSRSFVYLHPRLVFFFRQGLVRHVYRCIRDSFDEAVGFHLPDSCPTFLCPWRFELQRGSGNNFRFNYLSHIDTRYLKSCTPPFSEPSLCKFKLFARVKLKTFTTRRGANDICVSRTRLSREFSFRGMIAREQTFPQPARKQGKNNWPLPWKRLKIFGLPRYRINFNRVLRKH